jgi:hypothetical protein
MDGSIVPKPKTMTYVEYLDEKRRIEDQIDNTHAFGKIPHTPLFCTPNC